MRWEVEGTLTDCGGGSKLGLFLQMIINWRFLALGFPHRPS